MKDQKKIKGTTKPLLAILDIFPPVSYMAAARLVFEKAMVGTGWATSHPDCIDRLRKHYSHLVEGWFLARKATWALNRCTCMTTDSADYCMLVNEWAWLRS